MLPPSFNFISEVRLVYLECNVPRDIEILLPKEGMKGAPPKGLNLNRSLLIIKELAQSRNFVLDLVCCWAAKKADRTPK